MVGTGSFTPEKDATSDTWQGFLTTLPTYFWLKRTLDSDGRTTYNEVETYAMAVGHGADDETGMVLEMFWAPRRMKARFRGVYVKKTRQPG